jgi:ribonuclease J
MRIRIHRGTQQIGGTCIELEAAGQRIALDLGLPLDQDDSPDLLPRVPGFHEPDATLLAVVISHPHIDHYGLVRHLPPGVPLVIGETAARILNAAAQFIRDAATYEPSRTLHDRRPLTLGPFKITPYLVDHAAYDAYALLVEADGQRVFYSGDFRGHGRKAALFERMLREPPQGIDVLLMEGTTLGREGTDIGYPSEQDLERAFVAACAETSGMILALASAQNIDRVVTLFRACKRTGRVLIIDLYAAAVLAATGNERIPQSDWPEVRLFTPERQRRWVVRNELFDVLHTHKSRRIYPQHLADLAPRAALLFRDSMTEDLARAACLDGARLIYSMWPGYLAEPRMQRLLKWVERHGIPLQHIHTSGHASAADLRRFAKALAPKRLVPIHTFHPERYGSLYHTIDPRQDGEWWDM